MSCTRVAASMRGASNAQLAPSLALRQWLVVSRESCKVLVVEKIGGLCRRAPGLASSAKQRPGVCPAASQGSRRDPKSVRRMAAAGGRAAGTPATHRSPPALKKKGPKGTATCVDLHQLFRLPVPKFFFELREDQKCPPPLSGSLLTRLLLQQL